MTIKDIAAKAGISYAGVSLALRNSPRIGLATRARVQAVAQAMGYQPNPMATGLANLRGGSTTATLQASLAWLNFWPNPSDLRTRKEFDGYWVGAEAAARKCGYRLEEFTCNEETPLSRVEQILHARGIQGIFLPPHLFTPDWGDFHWERFSVVRFGRSLSGPNLHVVTADQVANTTLAFENMRELGYRRIGLIEDHKERRYGRLFKAGFLLAQSEMETQSNIPVFTMSQAPASATNVPAFKRWLAKVKPDALLSDTHKATELLDLCGCRIPEDIGFAATSVLDGHTDAGIFQNPEEIGRVAFLVLNSLIHDNDRGIPTFHREILVKGSWMDGDDLPRIAIVGNMTPGSARVAARASEAAF